MTLGMWSLLTLHILVWKIVIAEKTGHESDGILIIMARYMNVLNQIRRLDLQVTLIIINYVITIEIRSLDSKFRVSSIHIKYNNIICILTQTKMLHE